MFPFDLLDAFVPDLAQWMGGKSENIKKRYLRAGAGLSLMGGVFISVSLISPKFMGIFFDEGVGIFVGMVFGGCGIFLLFSILVDLLVNRKAQAPQQENQPS